ncbi:MAG: phytanoyl-CoA dioxygenase family protein [Sinobacterium sp.]|nr:phytanoyl-CoA dioxygenase family protein [Sinobacterium sp.]
MNTQALVVSSITEAPDTLRARFQEYGYLHLKNFVPKDQCQHLLDNILSTLGSTVSFDEARQLPLLTGAPFFETDAFFDQVYPHIQALPRFQNIFHEEPIYSLMKLVVQAEPFIYPMKMARLSTPKKLGFETPPHQDAHSHQSGDTMAGIWIPLHDVSASMGRLMILPHSHKQGVRPVHNADGVGGVQCEIYADENTWHVSDVKQGDVIIFHACCVHKAEPNTSDDVVRISIDTRFCDYGAPVYSSNLAPHHGWRIKNLNWNFIYKNWTDEPNQYYWKDYPHFHGPSEADWKKLAQSINDKDSTATM